MQLQIAAATWRIERKRFRILPKLLSYLLPIIATYSTHSLACYAPSALNKCPPDANCKATDSSPRRTRSHTK